MNKVSALSLFGVACLICHAAARPQEASAAPAPAAEKGNITIVKNDISPLDKGSYSYDIELSDGTKLIQSGHTEAPSMGETEPSIVIEGSYAYVAPDGKQISITYTAGKQGFVPKGDVIPSQGNPSSSQGSSTEAAPAAASAAS